MGKRTSPFTRSSTTHSRSGMANRTVNGRPSRSNAPRSASVSRRQRPSSPPGGTPFAMAACFVASSSSAVQ